MARLASTNFRRSPLRCFPTGLSGVAIGVQATLKAKPAAETESRHDGGVRGDGGQR